MKGEDNKDILMDKALKGNPYSTPEGYFDSFKVKAESFTRPKTVSVNIWQQLTEKMVYSQVIDGYGHSCWSD